MVFKMARNSVKEKMCADDKAKLYRDLVYRKGERDEFGKIHFYSKARMNYWKEWLHAYNYIKKFQNQPEILNKEYRRCSMLIADNGEETTKGSFKRLDTYTKKFVELYDEIINGVIDSDVDDDMFLGESPDTYDIVDKRVPLLPLRNRGRL